MSYLVHDIKTNKILFFILLSAIAFNLTGCKIEKKETDNEKTTTLGIYKSNLVEMESGESVFAISKDLSEGAYVVTGAETAGKNVWHVDENDNWEKKYNINELLDIDDSTYCEAFVSPDGGIFAGYGEDIKYVFIDMNGKRNEIDMNLPKLKTDFHEDGDENGHNEFNHILTAKFLDDFIYAVDANYNIYEINTNDYSVKLAFENTDFEYFYDFCVYERTIITLSYDMICYEGLDSHEHEEAMYNRFKPFFDKVLQSYKETCLDIDNGKLRMLSGDKIFTLNLDNDDISEAKVVGTGANQYIMSQITVGDNLFVMARDFADTECKLYKYTVMDEVETPYGAEPCKIKIWSLYGNANCEEAVRRFTDKYPNVEVEVEIGVVSDTEDYISEVDAVKNLNTAILTGDVPDIIYMDGVDYKQYIESGVLCDISELINEMKDSGDYYNNILDSFNENGKIYMVPTSFSFIAKIGIPEELEASENIEEFANYIENQNSDQSVIYDHNVIHYTLFSYYRDIKPDIEKGTLDRDKVVAFFEAAKKLHDVAGKKEDILHLFFMKDYSTGAGMYDGTFRFSVANIACVEDGLMSCGDMVEQINGTMEMPAKDYKDNYTCTECIAISSESPNLDMAKEYLKIALGEECQSGFYGAVALRVNRKAFKNYSEYLLELDEPNESEIKFFQSQLLEFENIIENLSEPFYVDYTLDQIMIDELNNYITYGKDRDEAVDSALEKIKLYMAE